MPDQKNEAFLQREAERENRRRSARRYKLKTILVFALAMAFITCGYIYISRCIYSYQTHSRTRIYVFDNYHNYGNNDPELYKIISLQTYMESGSFGSEDQEKLEEAYAFLSDYTRASAVTIIEEPGSFWDSRTKILDIKYELIWDETDNITQEELYYLSLYLGLTEIHTVDEFNTIIDTYQGTDFSEVTTNPEYKWFCCILAYSEDFFDSYYNLLTSLWCDYCNHSGNQEYSSVPVQVLTPEDIVELAQSCYPIGDQTPSINLSKYEKYIEIYGIETDE